MTQQGGIDAIDRSIPFVETHYHLWERERFHYEWLDDPGRAEDTEFMGDYKLLRTDWGPTRLFREFYGQNVIKSVHVEADMTGDRIAETAWLQEVHEAYGMPDAIVVRCDLDRPDAAEQLDGHLAASPLVRGVRMHHLPDDGSATSDAGLAALRERGLSFDLNPPPGRLDEGQALAGRFPTLQFVLGHAGMPPVGDADGVKAWGAQMTELASAENVACKISGMGMTDHFWTIDSIRDCVLRCIDAFGLERSMFATNWPVDILYATYHEQVDAYRVILADAGFSVDEQHALLHGNAERLYGI